MKILKETVDGFFLLPVGAGLSDDLFKDLADGLDRVVREYINFVASCGKYHTCTFSTPNGMVTFQL